MDIETLKKIHSKTHTKTTKQERGATPFDLLQIKPKVFWSNGEECLLQSGENTIKANSIENFASELVIHARNKRSSEIAIGMAMRDLFMEDA